jgi:hypothetical protein
MRALALLLALVAMSIAAPAPAQTRPEAPAWRTLERFSSEAEFYQYLRDVRIAERRARGETLQKQQPRALSVRTPARIGRRR